MSVLAALEAECDPGEYLRRARSAERGLKPPFDRLEAVVIATKGIALCEVGESDRAREILEILKDSVFKSRKAEDKAVGCMWAWILADKLEDDSQERMLKEWLVGYLPSLREKKLKALMEQDVRDDDFRERAAAEGRWGELAEFLEERSGRAEAGQVRTKVLLKASEAACRRKAGDAAGEAACLAYVAEHGKGLEAARLARARLEELGEWAEGGGPPGAPRGRGGRPGKGGEAK